MANTPLKKLNCKKPIVNNQPIIQRLPVKVWFSIFILSIRLLLINFIPYYFIYSALTGGCGNGATGLLGVVFLFISSNKDTIALILQYHRTKKRIIKNKIKRKQAIEAIDNKLEIVE